MKPIPVADTTKEPVPHLTPTERLQASRHSMSLVLRQEPWPGVQGVLQAARLRAQHYPLATVAVLALGVVLVLRARPWRWLPLGAGLGLGVRSALGQLAWRTAMRALERTVLPPKAKNDASVKSGKNVAVTKQ